MGSQKMLIWPVHNLGLTPLPLPQKLKSVKSNTACGPDSVTIEMLEQRTPELQVI